ncbi:F-ATPase epsilon subunit [Bacteroidales bacterium Barb6]|nr:F-ATPase epsilon subunit [Bacteroidales bacterium Barb6]
MYLEIISPEKTVYSGEADAVTLPGTSGSFTVLSNHAPILSALKRGQLLYRTGNKEEALNVEGGFMEMRDNRISVCIDGLSK